MFSRNKEHSNFKIYDKNVNIYYFQTTEDDKLSVTGLFYILIRNDDYTFVSYMDKNLYVYEYDINDVSYDDNILSFRIKNTNPSYLKTIKCIQLTEEEYKQKLSLAPSVLLGKEIEQILKYVPQESSKKIFEELVLKTKGKFKELIRDNDNVVGEKFWSKKYQAKYVEGMGFIYSHAFIPEVVIKEFINYYVDKCLTVVNQPEIKEFQKIKEILDGIH